MYVLVQWKPPQKFIGRWAYLSVYRRHGGIFLTMQFQIISKNMINAFFFVWLKKKKQNWKMNQSHAAMYQWSLQTVQ